MVRRNLSNFINANKKFKGVKRFQDTRGKNVRFKNLKLNLVLPRSSLSNGKSKPSIKDCKWLASTGQVKGMEP